MALADLIDLSTGPNEVPSHLWSILDLGELEKMSLTQERIDAAKPTIRKYAAFWREYPDMFVDFLVCGRSYERTSEVQFKFYYYQRVFLRSVCRYQYIYCVFPRASTFIGRQ